MNKILVLFMCFSLGIHLCSCGQSKKSNIKEMNYFIINENYDEQFEIQHFQKEPFYSIQIYSSACSFEILVNDMPAFKFYNNGGLQGTEIPILSILESGNQELTIRLYPSIDEGKFYEKGLIKATKFKAIIKRGTTEDMMNDTEQEILMFEIPHTKNNEGIEEYIEAGKDFAEYKMTFEANVPYKLNGWKDGIDLTKENSLKLEKEILEAYKEYSDLILNADYETIMKAVCVREKEINQALFLSKEEIEYENNEFRRFLTNPTIEQKSFKNFELKFYGNGKVIALERTDLKNRGESAIRFGYEEDGKRLLNYYGLYLYKPKGSDKFVVIR